MKECQVSTCLKTVIAKGLCPAHYRRMRRYGSPEVLKQRQMHGFTLRERFWHYVQKTSGCWYWVGYKDPQGYGRLHIDGRPELAHRLSWKIHDGDIPQNKHILHECDNPACVNPDHLYIGNQLSNMQDMWRRGRAKPGHLVGEKHGMSKLTEAQVRDIRKSDKPGTALATRYGISTTTICDIRKGRIWKHIK